MLVRGSWAFLKPTFKAIRGLLEPIPIALLLQVLLVAVMLNSARPHIESLVRGTDPAKMIPLRDVSWTGDMLIHFLFGIFLFAVIIGPRATRVIPAGLATTISLLTVHDWSPAWQGFATLLFTIASIAFISGMLCRTDDWNLRATEWWCRKWREWRRAHLRIKHPEEVCFCPLCRNDFPFERAMVVDLHLGGGSRGLRICEECGEAILVDKTSLSVRTLNTVAANWR